VLCVALIAWWIWLKGSPPTPSVVLLWESEQLRLYNHADADLFLWGDKLDDIPADVEQFPRTIPKTTGFYYFLPDGLRSWAQAEIGANGQRLVPFDVYLKDAAQKKYTARFYLLIVMNGSAMTVHTQQLGVIDNGW
jgi:hypothetical protein